MALAARTRYLSTRPRFLARAARQQQHCFANTRDHRTIGAAFSFGEPGLPIEKSCSGVQLASNTRSIETVRLNFRPICDLKMDLEVSYMLSQMRFRNPNRLGAVHVRRSNAVTKLVLKIMGWHCLAIKRPLVGGHILLRKIQISMTAEFGIRSIPIWRCLSVCNPT